MYKKTYILLSDLRTAPSNTFLQRKFKGKYTEMYYETKGTPPLIHFMVVGIVIVPRCMSMENNEIVNFISFLNPNILVCTFFQICVRMQDPCTNVPVCTQLKT